MDRKPCIGLSLSQARDVAASILLLIIPATCRAGAGPQVLARAPAISNVAWTPPPTTVDPEYVRVAKDLLGNGLADPRGGRFSHVTVMLGDGLGRPQQPLKGPGWVLPDGKSAVLMDGLL